MIGKTSPAPAPWRRFFILYSLSLVLFFAASGCRAPEGGSDLAYLDESAPPVGGGALLPARPSLIWISVSQDARVPVTMQTRYLGPQTVAGRTGARYEVQINDLPFQQEVYEESADGAVWGLATGPNARLHITPPLPIAPAARDIRAGTVRTWRGALADTKTKQSFPAEARIRIGGRDIIRTKIGALAAYRFDIAVRVKGDAQTHASTLWLSPGVGIVRQRIAVAPGRVARFELISFNGLPQRASKTPARGANAAAAPQSLPPTP